MVEVAETAHTAERGFSGEICLHHESLRGFADIDNTIKVAQFKVIAEDDLVEFKRKVVVITDFLVNDKANVNAERFFGTRHGSGKWRRMNDEG